MSKYIVHGGNRLKGEIEIEGAKNSLLPILAATILNSGISVIGNCSRFRDTDIMIQILSKIGCSIVKAGKTLTVDTSNIVDTAIPEEYAVEMRSSIILIGSLLTKFGHVKISYPGGCEIGPRPMDLHLKGLRSMGAKIFETHGYIYCETSRLKGCDIHLDYPSVGATENLLMAAVLAYGTTCIRNAAKEPEIVDLVGFLKAMGAKISGEGTSTIVIEGVSELKDAEYSIMPDRIVAGTYLCAAAITSGEITLLNTGVRHMEATISVLRESGCKVFENQDSVRLFAPKRLKAIDVIKTLPYPGFPTDMQAQVVAMLAVARGTSLMVETVFENRYKHIEEINKMGAIIRLEGRLAVIKGVKNLRGTDVFAKDLRGGASLVVAGLAANGETVVNDIKYIERGYENLVGKLAGLGADICEVE